MRRPFRTLSGMTLVAMLVGTTTRVTAGTPLDATGEVTGFVPPVRNFAKCERWVSKRAALASMCILKCHEKKVALAYRNLAFDEEACETQCNDKYQQHVAILKPGVCPPCLDEANRTALYAPYENLAEQVTGLFYCAPGAPIDADDTGFVPTLKNELACEQQIALNAIKVIKCIKLVCHRKLADSLANRDSSFNEPACRRTDALSSCLARYESANGSLIGCPTCIDDATERLAVFDMLEGTLDAVNGLGYCASPGGAFLE